MLAMRCRHSVIFSIVSGILLFTGGLGWSSAQAIVAVHGLKVGDCVRFSNWNGMQTGMIAQTEYAGGYQVKWNGGTIPVGANSRDIQLCPAGTPAPGTATVSATGSVPAKTPPAPIVQPASAATVAAQGGGFKVGDCVQFSYANGWETATIAKPLVAGAYQVNWGSIVVPASGDPKYIRACPGGTAAAGTDAATKARLASLPKGNGIGAQYGTRNPATCGNRKVAITAATAKMLLACDSEGLLGDKLDLITDIALQVGSPRAFNYSQDSSATGIDARQPVYDIRGSYSRYQCAMLSEEPNDFAKTHNCFKYPATAGGYGRCYTDTFGDKHCEMTGGGPTQLKDQIPPPAN